MRRFFPLLCGLLLVILAGCHRESVVKVLSNPVDEAAARNYIDLLRQDKYEAIQDHLGQGVNIDRATFEQMRSVIPAGEPSAVTVVGSYTWDGTDSTGVHTTFEYQFPERWLLISVAISHRGLAGVSTIVGFTVQPLPHSMETMNRFTFAGKGARQYAMFAAVCAVPLIILYALAACWRTRMRRKWLWIIFIIFGLGRVTMNWTTGELSFVERTFHRNPGSTTVTAISSEAAVQLFGAGVAAEPFGPWMLSVSLPLGALVFLMRRKRFVAVALPAKVPVAGV